MYTVVFLSSNEKSYRKLLSFLPTHLWQVINKCVTYHK